MIPNYIPNSWYWYPTHVGDIIAFMGKWTDLGMTSEDGMKADQSLLRCGLLRGDFAKYWF